MEQDGRNWMLCFLFTKSQESLIVKPDQQRPINQWFSWNWRCPPHCNLCLIVLVSNARWQERQPCECVGGLKKQTTHVSVFTFHYTKSGGRQNLDRDVVITILLNVGVALDRSIMRSWAGILILMQTRVRDILCWFVMACLVGIDWLPIQRVLIELNMLNERKNCTPLSTEDRLMNVQTILGCQWMPFNLLSRLNIKMDSIVCLNLQTYRVWDCVHLDCDLV
jgi:hypothetical protein